MAQLVGVVVVGVGSNPDGAQLVFLEKKIRIMVYGFMYISFIF